MWGVGVGIVGRLDEFQRRHSRASFPLAVLYKYVDDGGGYLAALIAYYAFVSLFPLLLLLSTILGLVLAGDPDLQQRVLDSALSQFPVVGDQLGQPNQIGGGAIGVTVGILGSLYGGLGVGQAVQNAMNTTWAVPRNSRPIRSSPGDEACCCWSLRVLPCWPPLSCPLWAVAAQAPWVQW